MSEPNIVTTQGVVDALAAWVSSTLAGHTYPAPDGTYKEVRVFTHNLPEPEGDDDADLAFCPFCIVHAGSGTVEDWGSQTMPIVLLFCVYDTGTSRQGYRDLLSIKEKVMAAALKTAAWIRARSCYLLTGTRTMGNTGSSDMEPWILWWKRRLLPQRRAT